LNLEPAFLETSFSKKVISKKPWGLPGDVGCVGWGPLGNYHRGCYYPIFEIKLEITISRFEIIVFEITVFEVKPSYQILPVRKATPGSDIQYKILYNLQAEATLLRPLPK